MVHEWETRKEFLRLSKEEEDGLRLLQPLVIRHVDELVEAFYRHLMAFEETRRLLSDALIGIRLKKAQKEYLLSLVTGPYDLAYREGRVRIGEVHERIGLTPRWYLGAYALYLNLLHPLIFREFRDRPEKCQFLRIALTKVIFLDIGLALEAYVDRAADKLEFANRELAAMAKELGHGLDQRTRELLRSQERLRQTERLAELGTLASGMAHEIGTPMNVILGRAEYLMRRTEEETTKKGLETIVTQVERITKIMNQLLTFARRRPSERRSIDLVQTLKECLEVLRERFSRQQIQVESHVQPEIMRMYADPDHLSQVLLNLFINAVHAMPEGGTLRIDMKESQGQVKLVVSDTGCGMSRETLPKIFDPFFTTKEAGRGTGLGLTVVHGIIEEHGGSITVESELGRGTTFTTILPVNHDSK